MSDVTDTDREKAILLIRRTPDSAIDTLAALIKAGWRPGGARVAPTREALLELLNSPQHAPSFTHGPDGECTACPVPLYECGPEETVDALLVSGLLGERRDSGELTLRPNPPMPPDELLHQLRSDAERHTYDFTAGLRAIWRHGCDTGMVAP